MRIAHLADLHLGYRQYHRQNPNGINQREADVANAFRYFGELAGKDGGRVVDVGPDVLSRVVYQPVGVCALIARA